MRPFRLAAALLLSGLALWLLWTLTPRPAPAGAGQGVSLAALTPHPEAGSTAARTYLQALHERVHPRWGAFLAELPRLDAPYQDAGLGTTVVVGVNRSGALISLAQTERTGLSGFDDAPIDVLHDIEPLPPPPLSLRSDDGVVYLRWRFLRRPPGCEDVTVMERSLPPMEAVPQLVRDDRVEDALLRARTTVADLPQADQRTLLHGLILELALASARAKATGERAAAAEVLARFDALAAESALLRLLDDDESAVRHAALQALAVRPLTPVPQGLPWSQAVQAHESVQAFIRGALRRRLGSEAAEDRALAATLLRRRGDEQGLMYLRSLLAAGKSPVETTAQLVALGDGAEATRITRSLLSATDPALQVAGVRAATILKEPGLLSGVRAMVGASHEPGELLAYLDALITLGGATPPDVRKTVLQLIGHPQPQVRARAIIATGFFGDLSASLRYRLIDMLADKAPEVRAAAAETLVSIAGEKVRDELLRLARDPQESVRLTLLQATLAHPYASAPILQRRLCQEAALPAKRGARTSAASHDLRAACQTAGSPLTLLAPTATSAAAPASTELWRVVITAREPVPRLRAAAAWLAQEAR